MFKINPEKRLVIIQCDSGHLNGDLIACARHRIYDLRAKADHDQITHCLFIIHLPHRVTNSSFVGFQGDPWISSHIDDLRPTSDSTVSTSEAIGLTISELFLGRPKDISSSEGLAIQRPAREVQLPNCDLEAPQAKNPCRIVESEVLDIYTHHESPTTSRAPLFKRLHSCIQAAASKLKDSTSRRSTKRVGILVHLIPKEPPVTPG